MFDEGLFVRKFPLTDGIYQCLPDEAYSDRIKKVEIATFSERAHGFSEEKTLHLTPEHQEVLRPLLRLPKDAVILEIGGGDGRFAFHLMRSGYTVIESDIAPGSVQKTKSIAEKHAIPNGVFATIDAENLPFREGTLDAIFMVATLHHLPNPEKAIAEFRRCLKAGGYLLILREPASWQFTLFGPVFWVMRKVIRKKNKEAFSLIDDETAGFSIRAYKRLLAEFQNLEIRPVDYIYKFYYNFLILLNKMFKRPLRENERIRTFLRNVDQKIQRLPVIKNFPWDWDVYCRK